jgi:regulator of replication initiation timing
MLVKLFKTYFETDDIICIRPIIKYNGELKFNIELTKDSVEVRWNISKMVDDEETLMMKMEGLRKELAKIKNQSDTVIELGQGISMKKPKNGN